MSIRGSRGLQRAAIFIARVLFDVFRVYFTLIEELTRLISPGYKRPRILRQIIERDGDVTLDERIQKIDAAKENLQDAINAIDELRSQASANKLELDEALGRIAEAERQKQELSAQLDTLKQVAEVDTAAFRRVVGLPTKSDLWRERLIGFVSGIVASVIASTIFIILQRLLFSK